MSEGHFGKAQGEVGPFAQCIRIAEGTADDEGDVAVTSQGQAIDFFRQLGAGNLFTNHIQQNHIGIFRNDGHQARCFLFQHLLLDSRAGVIGHALLVDSNSFQLTKGSKALGEFRNACIQILFFNLAHASNRYFHLP